jgi:hypothetical protein
MKVRVQKITSTDKTAYPTEDLQVYVLFFLQIPYQVYVHLRTQKKHFLREWAITSVQATKKRDSLIDMSILCGAQTIVNMAKHPLHGKGVTNITHALELLKLELELADDPLAKNICIQLAQNRANDAGEDFVIIKRDGRFDFFAKRHMQAWQNAFEAVVSPENTII